MSDLDKAREAYAADIERLDELDDDQVDYLSRLNEVADPLSDDIDCDGDADG